MEDEESAKQIRAKHNQDVATGKKKAQTRKADATLAYNLERENEETAAQLLKETKNKVNNRGLSGNPTQPYDMEMESTQSAEEIRAQRATGKKTNDPSKVKRSPQQGGMLSPKAQEQDEDDDDKT